MTAVLAASLQEAADQAVEEAFGAAQKWPPMNSAHEAYAVLLEEVALRFVVDICDEERGRK